MKKITSILICFIFTMWVAKTHAQFKVLLVNDNNSIIENTDTFKASLNRSGFPYDYFNAVDSGIAPPDYVLSNYDMVIWYTSTDGFGLNLWYQSDIDNDDLKNYLDQGGMLWLAGNDFLFDKYGTAPDTFSAGNFVYDYLGISCYMAQSYGDDGGTGVPQMNAVPTQTIFSIDTIMWLYPTLWWADGCLPVANADSIYKMGPSSYLFSNLYSAIYYNNTISKTLSFFFDPALIDTFYHRDELVKDVLNFFDSQKSSSLNNRFVKNNLSQVFAFPNPFTDKATLVYSLEEESQVTLKIFNLFGQEMMTLIDNEKHHSGFFKTNVEMKEFPAGIYFYSLQSYSRTQSGRIVKLK